MKIYFWQDILSPHLYPFLNSIKKIREDWDVNIIIQDDISKKRLDLGWKEQSKKSENFNIIFSPNSQRIKEISVEKDVLHIFSGIKNTVRNFFILHYIAWKSSNRIYIISESPNLLYHRKITRLLASFLIEKPLIKKIRLVFAIGELSYRWFLNQGFSDERLASFGYVVRESIDPISNIDNDKREVSFLFIGQLIERKGLKRFIKALFCLSEKNWKFDIVGDGIQFNELKSLVNSLSLNKNISFLGKMSNDDCRRILSSYDYCVLPSYFDGWGATTNEALMEGVAAFCSKTSGSSDLLHSINPDLVFDESTIKIKLSKILNDGKIPISHKKIIKQWAHKSISGEAVARYFVDCIEWEVNNRPSPKPIPPWHNEFSL